MLRRPARLLAVVVPLILPLLGFGSCEQGVIAIGIPSPGGGLPVEIALPSSTDPATAIVRLDGADVTATFAAGGPGLVGSLPIPAPGVHLLRVTRPFHVGAGITISLTGGRSFDVPDSAPALLAVEPAAGAVVPRSAWLRFRLATSPAVAALDGFGFALECDGKPIARAAHALADGTLILNPTPALPAASSCRAVWRDDGGDVAETTFSVAADAAGPPATLLYDRTDPLALAPFPDVYYTIADASMPSGLAIDLPAPPFTEAFQAQAFEALAAQTIDVDGWSRMTHVVLAFSHPLDPSAVPEDAVASMDPFAPIALIDVDPASPDFGERIPYRMLVRTDEAPDGSFDHAAMLFPGIEPSSNLLDIQLMVRSLSPDQILFELQG
jgi:hypothetical protein